MSGICEYHEPPIERAFTVSARTGALETAINRLKFQNMKAAARSLGELLHDSLPTLPNDIILVPIPTVRSHIRQRGYDQVELITRHFAAHRELPIKRLLFRQTSITQHTVGKKERLEQSIATFGLVKGVDIKGSRVLLIDDVVTTGSTLTAAAKILYDAGATVWVATLAYQPLD